MLECITQAMQMFSREKATLGKAPLEKGMLTGIIRVRVEYRVEGIYTSRVNRIE